MLVDPNTRDHVTDPAVFLDLLVFEVHRQLMRAWIDRCGADGAPPRLSDLAAHWRELGRDYAYRWALTPAGDDLVCAEAGPRFTDYMQRGLRGSRFSDHAPGPLGARMLATHLDCLAAGTPFAVLRRRHPYPERGSGYEAIIAPVAGEPAMAEADSLLGHLMPFAPASVADVLAKPGLRPDIGRRLILPATG